MTVFTAETGLRKKPSRTSNAVAHVAFIAKCNMCDEVSMSGANKMLTMSVGKTLRRTKRGPHLSQLFPRENHDFSTVVETQAQPGGRDDFGPECAFVHFFY